MGEEFNSDVDSDERSRSGSPIDAPTPGFSLEHHDPRSGSASPASQHSGSRSRASRSVSRRSGSVASGSRRSGSNASQRSGSARSGSHRSGSRGSGSHRSGSHRSGSRGSRHSGSRSRSGSRSSGSNKSGSRSRSGSKHSARSGSRKSGSRSRSGSRRSGSAASNRSGSGSRRSRSASAVSNKSGTKGSRTPSGSRRNSVSRSRSATPKSSEKRKKGVLSDSESDAEAKARPKKSAIIDSDSEPEKDEEPKEKVTADAIFGDDVSDISTDNEGEKESAKEEEAADTRRSKTPDRARSRSRSRSSNDQDFERVYQQLSDEEKQPDAEPEPIPETRIDVEIPRIVTNLGRDIHFVKMPNFLSVETRPFDAETYEDEIDEEDVMDEEGRQRLKLKVGNTIRWRETYNPDGTIKRESNARIIKWSDGSMSLHLGSEIFDVYKQPLTGDHNHLFIRQGTGLQGQAVFRSKLTFRPHSTESFTHKKMTISLADRSQKTSGIKILTQVGYDPDTDRYQKLKSEEEKLRQAMRARAGVPSKQPKRSSTAANASYHDEGSDDEGAISIAAIKGKYKKDKQQKPSASAIYSSDEEGSDIDSRRKKKIDRSKALRALEDEDGGSSDEGSGSGSESGSGNDDAKNKSGGSEDNDSD